MHACVCVRVCGPDQSNCVIVSQSLEDGAIVTWSVISEISQAAGVNAVDQSVEVKCYSKSFPGVLAEALGITESNGYRPDRTHSREAKTISC